MAYRYRRLRELSRFCSRIRSSCRHEYYGRDISSLALPRVPQCHTSEEIKSMIIENACHLSRFSTTSELSHESPLENDLLSFIQSTLDEHEGPYHHWLNTSEGSKGNFNRDGTFLVLAGEFLEVNGSDHVVWLEKVKLLQQRFPQLHVFGFHCSRSFYMADKSHVVHFIMKEYVTFPILLSKKKFSEMERGPCYIMFKNFRNPMFYPAMDLDPGFLKTAIEELHMQESDSHLKDMQDTGTSRLFSEWRVAYMKQAEFGEPFLCSFAHNLLLHFPGCISADESGNRLFLSDSNHHRIIIFDGNGKILDSIGSYPGFEDGEFQSAKLARPAGSFYHSLENCLFFVDSENHAIRKADLGKRVVETLHPASYTTVKGTQLWTWIMMKLGFGGHADKKAEEPDSPSLMFPWHIIKSADDKFLILNRSLAVSWIMDMSTWEIKEVVKGLPKVFEIYGQLIMQKVSLMEQMPRDWLHQQTDNTSLIEGLPYADLVSSLTTFNNSIIISDAAGQEVLKLSRESGELSKFQFSNFGILGFPYWHAFPLEKICSVVDRHRGARVDHHQCFSLLPGRVNIHIYVEVPVDTELVEPLQEGCIWRQARGSAVEISGLEDIGKPSEKVGVAQQWYDELDNLAYSMPRLESGLEGDDSRTSHTDENSRNSDEIQDKKICINCAVNTSPGTSEAIVCATLYLKLRRNDVLQGLDREKCAATIADILCSKSNLMSERETCIEFLLKSKRYLRDLIFIKPLHVRIRLECPDHPKADNSKDIILTDSSIEVQVIL